MNLTDRIKISPNVMSRNVGNETVLLDLAGGTYFGLDPVGARIWQLFEGGKTLAETCDTLLAEYEVTREALERDTLKLAGELLDKQLIAIA